MNRRRWNRRMVVWTLVGGALALGAVAPAGADDTVRPGWGLMNPEEIAQHREAEHDIAGFYQGALALDRNPTLVVCAYGLNVRNWPFLQAGRARRTAWVGRGRFPDRLVAGSAASAADSAQDED